MFLSFSFQFIYLFIFIVKIIKFGEDFYVRKVHEANILFIYLEPTEVDNSSFIFTFTTVYHDYQ